MSLYGEGGNACEGSPVFSEKISGVMETIQCSVLMSLRRERGGKRRGGRDARPKIRFGSSRAGYCGSRERAIRTGTKVGYRIEAGSKEAGTRKRRHLGRLISSEGENITILRGYTEIRRTTMANWETSSTAKHQSLDHTHMTVERTSMPIPESRCHSRSEDYDQSDSCEQGALGYATNVLSPPSLFEQPSRNQQLILFGLLCCCLGQLVIKVPLRQAAALTVQLRGRKQGGRRGFCPIVSNLSKSFRRPYRRWRQSFQVLRRSLIIGLCAALARESRWCLACIVTTTFFRLYAAAASGIGVW